MIPNIFPLLQIDFAAVFKAGKFWAGWLSAGLAWFVVDFTALAEYLKVGAAVFGCLTTMALFARAIYEARTARRKDLLHRKQSRKKQ